MLLSVGMACYGEVYSATTLVITLTDATTATYDVAKKPTISFDDVHMVVTSDAVETKYLRSNIENFYFLAEVEGIHQVDGASNFGFRFVDGEHVQLSGIAAQHVTLYSISGQVVSSADPTDDKIEISLQGLPSGTYVLKVADHSIKITK